MADDIRLSTNFWRHPKTVKLIRKGGLDAVRSLQILWCFCAQERTDGLLHGMDADDIEIAADWQGEPGKFVELLLSGGWMECSPGCSGEGTYALHGWEERQAYVSKAESRREQARAAAETRWRNKRGMRQEKPDDAASNAAVCDLHAAHDADACCQHAASNADSRNQHMPNHAERNAPIPIPDPIPDPEIPPLTPPQGGACGEEGGKPSSAGRDAPAKTDAPSKGHPEWPVFLSCWELWPVQQGQEEAWREWMRLHANGTLAPSYAIREAIARLLAEDSRWRRGKVPRMAKWLHGKGWEDKPFIEPQDGGTMPVAVGREGPRSYEDVIAAADAAAERSRKDRLERNRRADAQRAAAAQRRDVA